ncbi:MAG: amidohydrolase family protein [Lishizhenia sp.]
MRNIFLLLLLVFTSTIFAQNKILIVGGKLHIGNGSVVENGLIGIANGEITLVKNALSYSYNTSDWDTIINASGKEVYPGFVAPNTTLGLTEIDAVRATRDFDDVGTFNPHVRSLIAFNTESKVISTVRTNGVLIGQATPRGGRISGTSSVMHFNGWNWEDAVIREDDGIHLNWPATLSGGGWWTEPGSQKKNEKYQDQLKEIEDFFAASKAYAEERSPEKIDFRFKAMKACFDGNRRVYFHANELKALTDILDFVARFEIAYPVIVGGYDSYLLTQQLKDANIPVMLTRPHSLPMNEDDDIELPFKLAHLLKEGGVKFCIQNAGEMEAMNARNIPFLAGTTQAYGLSEEDAIASISLWACQILGIDAQFGSLTEGKSATLFISDGNALEMKTNNVTTAMIQGKFISLVNSQIQLYQKYKQKYEKEGKL